MNIVDNTRDTDTFFDASDLLPNEAGSQSFAEEEQVDEIDKAIADERHIIRSSKGALLDDFFAQLDQDIDNTTRISYALSIAEEYKVTKEEALIVCDVISKVLEGKKGYYGSLAAEHAPERMR